MPGIRIVEEPTSDLWFAPDQCVVPEQAARELEEAGFLGLGDYYDPMPSRMMDPGYADLAARSKGASESTEDPFGPPYETTASAAAVRRGEEFELTPATEEELHRQYLDEMAWREKLPALYRHASKEVIADIQKMVMYVSVNFKTGYSFNIRIQKYKGLLPAIPQGDPAKAQMHPTIGGTCSPSDWCMEHCYAKVGRFISWDKQHWFNLSVQQARYLQNLIVSRMYKHAGDDEVTQQADIFYEGIIEKHNDAIRLGKFPPDCPPNLRWNGGGDFDDGTIRLVNKLTERHPDLLIWGFSRKKDTARTLIPRHNLRLQFSLDPSTPPKGRRGDSVSQLVKAAYHMHGHMCYATHMVGDERINELRQALAPVAGDKVRITTVFGFHCGALHTEIGDVSECSATNPRIYAGCQVCRWCMMNDQERAATPGPDGRVGVLTPNQSFFAHGGQPDFAKIEKENKHRVKNGYEALVPVTEDEVWDVAVG